ncbi:MAG: hypothetical protein RLZZ385_2092 [Pseudomonadota bacterium]|jgi:phage shock protein PspC (stress-responsive transcriptional regulator)
MSARQNSLRINREDRRFLGVCAGIADYFDVPVVLVRIIFIISVITWPTLFLGYFLLYFILDNDINAQKVQGFFSGNNMDHFRRLDYRRPIFRDMRNRRIAGVCSGIAAYLEINSFWIRLAAVLMLFIFGPYAVLAYAIGWFVLEPNPAPPHFSSHRERRQWRRAQRHERKMRHHAARAARYSSRFNPPEGEADGRDELRMEIRMEGRRETRKDADAAPQQKPEAAGAVQVDRVGEIYYDLENRMREIEAFVTSKRFRLHCEINRA